MGFGWDADKADANEVRHGVTFVEAVRVFDDPYSTEEYDGDHSTPEEPRFAKIGISATRLLFVVYTVRDDTVRIIHARQATRLMEKHYEQERNKHK